MTERRNSVEIFMDRRQREAAPTPLEKFVARRRAEEAKRKRRPNAYKILKATGCPYRHQHMIPTRILKRDFGL